MTRRLLIVALLVAAVYAGGIIGPNLGGVR